MCATLLQGERSAQGASYFEVLPLNKASDMHSRKHGRKQCHACLISINDHGQATNRLHR